MIKETCMQIVERVDALQYIVGSDFDVIIAKYDTGDTAASMRFMNKYYLQWINYMSEAAGFGVINPYVLTIHPRYFGCDKKEKLRVLVHELKHISPTKRGCIGHTGFGDEDTVKLVLQHEPELIELV